MKKALLRFFREAIPVVILMAVTTVIILCAVSPTFVKWTLIVVGSLVGLFVACFIFISVKSHQEAHKDDTSAEKLKDQQTSKSMRGSFLQALLITFGFIIGGLIVLAIPILVFMFLFPTYPMMVTAFGVIVAIVVIVWLFSLAKNGGDLTNVFWW